MKKKFVLLAMLVFSVVAGFAQSNSYIAIKPGVGRSYGYTTYENIRANKLSFSTKYGTAVRTWSLNIDVSYVKFTNNKRFGFSGGLRYNAFEVKLCGKGHELLFHDNNNTYFFKLGSLSQYVHYLGIPLGVEFVVTDPEAKVRMIFNVGANFDFKVASSVDAVIENAIISEEYANIIKENFEKPSPFCFSTYVGTGLRIGRPNGINGSITVEIPYYGYNSIGYASQRFGWELSGSVHFPLK